MAAVKNALRRKSSLCLTVTLTLVISGLTASWSEAGVPGTGIWMLKGTNHTYSITLVNLTNGRLITHSDPRDVVAHHACMTDDEAKPFVEPGSFPGTRIVLGPYESVLWASYSRIVGSGCAHYWDGKITFRADLESEWKFDLNFVSDKKSFWYKTGTWAYITPTTGDSWWYKEGWGHTPESSWPDISYLWTTLYGDGQMRNLTLMQPSHHAPITVALYSQDNNHLVLVVQETAALQRTANATYMGFALDWVDNPDDNVPEH
jgi:hypothetical protein